MPACNHFLHFRRDVPPSSSADAEASQRHTVVRSEYQLRRRGRHVRQHPALTRRVALPDPGLGKLGVVRDLSPDLCSTEIMLTPVCQAAHSRPMGNQLAALARPITSFMSTLSQESGNRWRRFVGAHCCGA